MTSYSNFLTSDSKEWIKAIFFTLQDGENDFYED